MRRGGAMLVLALALGLSACGDRERGPPEPQMEPTAGSTEPVSIIRPDVEVDREEPPLTPLRTSLPFPDGGAELSEAVRAELATVLQSPQMEKGGEIVLRGHTDSVGHDEANLRASRRRAEAVRDWLVENGVPEDRIRVIALGEQRPVRPNAHLDGTPDEEGRAANRRVDLVIAVPEDTPAAKPPGEPRTLVEEMIGD